MSYTFSELCTILRELEFIAKHIVREERGNTIYYDLSYPPQEDSCRHVDLHGKSKETPRYAVFKRGRRSFAGSITTAANLQPPRPVFFDLFERYKLNFHSRPAK